MQRSRSASSRAERAAVSVYGAGAYPVPSAAVAPRRPRHDCRRRRDYDERLRSGVDDRRVQSWVHRAATLGGIWYLSRNLSCARAT